LWEGLSLIEIYLENELDRLYFIKNIKDGLHAFIKNEVVELSLASDRLIIDIKETINFETEIKPFLTEVLKKHVIEAKEEVWLLDIIKDVFFYDDPQEQAEILAMAKSILSGERLDLPNVKKLFLTEKLIDNAFKDFITKDSKFCYESFLTFRLRGYFDRLIDCVEMAIDEFQLEQEYQNLVENLRYYLKKRTSKLTCVHLVIDSNFTFYDEYLNKLPAEKLEEYLDRSIIFEKGIPIQEMVISPLVSIAPKVIHIYSDELDKGVIHSIRNIFQERVKLYNKGSFHKKDYKTL
jgi:putative sporulation protein YtxC